MKIDRSKVKKSSSEVSEECHRVIHFLKTCNDDELLKELEKINVWYFGKCELYHWIDVLDRFDGILATVAKPMDGKQWIFEFDVLVDVLGSDKGTYQQSLIFHILKFTALLIEHSYARHLYNSIEHLIMLLDCADGSIILAVLNLIYVFSKRSNYLSRLGSDKKKILQDKLIDLAQSWGGLEAGCALNQCCSEDVPAGAGNVYFEYYLSDSQTAGHEKNKHGSKRYCIDMKNIHQISTSNIGEIMENILLTSKIPENIQMSFYHRLRLGHAMTCYKKRLQFVQARLQALSILVYSNPTTHVNTLVYDGLIEEIVDTLKINDENFLLSEVKGSCLKTLTAILHLDRNPRLQSVIDSTGATSYHGFLPTLVRQCIQHMTNSELEAFPQQLATSLFSFLYHLASFEPGCESLVASGLIEPLLKVVLWPGQDDHITFVTRAVRVIDLITNLDMAAFQSHSGLSALVGRLESEVALCSAFHGPPLPSTPPVITDGGGGDGDTTHVDCLSYDGGEQLTTTNSSDVNKPSTSADVEMKDTNDEQSKSNPVQCLPQRAALLKSILNFLKKAIPDPAFVENTRSLMDENLQNSLKTIISNAEYYGALLFLLATDVVTVFIFHEPSLLSSLQDSGLTWVVLRALIVKDVPATRENLASLPNTLSALCLNTRGLQAFVKCKPFERLFRILMSPEYLPAMKRRKTSDPQGDTAMHLGAAMDELMRHQPTLKTAAMKAIIQLLHELSGLGNDLSIIAFHPMDKIKSSKPAAKESEATLLSTTNNEDLSEDEMEEEYRSLLIRKQDGNSSTTDTTTTTTAATTTDPENMDETSVISKSHSSQRRYVPVVDYVLNVTKFLDNILSNNGTDDHCLEFVRLDGLKPLYSLLKMPNFPLEFPLMPACRSISQVIKSMSLLSAETKVFIEGLEQLNDLTNHLDTLYSGTTTHGSELLHELASTDNPIEALYDSTKTPIVHVMSSIHAYITVFVYLTRAAQSDVRSMSIKEWGSPLGRSVLEKLSALYMKLVWESSTLLTLCTPNCASEEDLSFAAHDLDKLTAKNIHRDDTTTETGKKGMSQLTLLKWLLTSSSHLGRALAELFGLLVQQCVGAPSSRLRRHNNAINQPVAPSVPARAIASLLTKLLVKGLSWKCPDEIKVPRLRLTFYICSVGFSTPMLFDNSKNAYHVMLYDNLKNPYHLMLQEFQRIGGVEVLFKAFDIVLEEFIIGRTDEEIKSTVGIGEFLEGWLGLVNRLVNTKFMFESTHALPTTSFLPGFERFDAAEFMTRVHKCAFKSIMKLWHEKVFKSSDNHVIGERILSIFCYIIKGESILPQKFSQQLKQKEKIEKSAGLGAGNAASSTAGGVHGLSGGVAENSVAAVGVGGRGGMYSEIYRTPAPTTFGVQQPEVNEVHVQTFVDMGFTQQHAREALIHSRNNFEAATEYLLTTPVHGTADATAASLAGANTNEGMDIDMSEEDMMIQAIAMSLVSSHEQQPDSDIAVDSASAAAATTSVGKESKNKLVKEDDILPPTERLTIVDFKEFSNTVGDCMQDIFYGSLELLDAVPSTVHTVCDLHLAMAKRNGEEWRNESLRKLTDQIMETARLIGNKITSSNETEQSLMQYLCESKEANQLSARLHLFLLMSQGLGNVWANILQKDSPFNLLVMLLKGVTNILSKVKQIGLNVKTPDLLAPLLLTFDQYEKIALFAQRKQSRGNSHTWKWFDDRSGRWCNYSLSNNSSIDTAYQAGESTVRFTAGRRRYMVFFKTLVQINEDTGNRRPIMLDVIQNKKTKSSENIGEGGTSGGVDGVDDGQPKAVDQSSPKEKSNRTGKKKADKQKVVDTKTEEMCVGEEKRDDSDLPESLNDTQIETIIEYCVDLIGLQVNPNTLNAIMRLLLRFTRQHDMAVRFASRNGVQHLLNLNETSTFPGALPLATLLLRHIVEDNDTMKSAIERAVAISANNGVPNMFCGVGQNSAGAKELHYLLRALGPVACRNTELYNESTKRIMRIGTSSWRGQVDKQMSPNTPQIVKVPPELKSIGLSGNMQTTDRIQNFVHVMLITLVERYVLDLQNKSKNIQKSDSTDKSTAAKKGDNKRKRVSDPRSIARTPQLVLVRRLTGEHIDEEEIVSSNTPSLQQQPTDGQLTDSSSASDLNSQQQQQQQQQEKKPLLSLADILRLLAELAKSYAGVARIIVDYVMMDSSMVSPGDISRPFLMEGAPILSFIFDCLLPHTNKETNNASSTSEVKETNKPSIVSTLARQLLCILGSYWHNTDMQNIFITELKNSLSRTLHLSESKRKHLQLQALFNLITAMVETAAPVSFSSQPPLQNTSFIKLLIKRGMISDLARIAHNLDLSSHDLVQTINVMLKPLEKLSNLANSQNVHTTSSKQDKGSKDKQTPTTTASSTTNQQQEDGASNNEPETRTIGDTAEPPAETNISERNEDLEDIVDVMVTEEDGEASIFGETLITSQTNSSGGVERRIYIAPNPMVGSNSELSESSSSETSSVDGDGNDNDDDDDDDDDFMSATALQIDGDAMNEDTASVSDAIATVVVSAHVNDHDDLSQDNTQQSRSTTEIEVVTSGQNEADLINTILTSEANDSAYADTIIINRGDDEETTSPARTILGDDDEDDDDVDDDDDETDEDDEDGNEDDDEGDDEGSDMDADDTIAAAEDAIIFEEAEETDDENNLAMLDLENHGGAMEFNFPQRPFSVHIPHMAADTSGIDAQTRSSFLSHPLLLRTSEQSSRNSASERISARSRSSRGERALTRQHGNSIHLHGMDAGSFARIHIGGDDMQIGGRGGGVTLGAGDDILYDLFGDSNEVIPSALSRWTVESRLLDSASVHDCVNALKPAIIRHLEKLQQAEIQEKIAEEKKKKEESKKAAAAAAAAAANNESVTTSSSTPSTETRTTTTAIADSSETTTQSAFLESSTTTSSGVVVSSVLTSQTFSTNEDVAEDMDVSPTQTQSVAVAMETSSTGTSATNAVIQSGNGTTPVVTNTIVDSLITPFNPLPEILPNAPQRQGLGAPRPPDTTTTTTTAMVGPAVTNTVSMTDILALPSSRNELSGTPQDLPRMNDYRRENAAAALTGGLGFTPQVTSSSLMNTPSSELPSVAEILATPADIPSLQQLRSGSLFPQTGGSPTTPRQSIRPSLRANINREMVPSPLSVDTNVTQEPDTLGADLNIGPDGVVSSSSSVLAADLAAAIMSQLVTSSPTPSITTTAQSVEVSNSPQSNLSEDNTTTVTTTTTQPTSVSNTDNALTSTTNDSSSATATSTLSGQGSSDVLQAAEQIQRELEGLGIPEGVDPSFLAALPDNIREEVLREQFGIRLRSAAAAAAATTVQVNPATMTTITTGSALRPDELVEPPQEVSPEFLAALPEEVQREVLEQQRLEQARFTAAQQRPEQPVDPAEFVRNLNPSLRRQVLADMDDSVLAVLPPELSTEAQGLRRELQQRRYQLETERALTRSDFSQLLHRHRGPGSGFQSIARLFPGRQINTWKVTDGPPGSMTSKKLGRQLLDPESLTCLLVLLFLNDTTLNASRLHRILRNLSYHNPTKQWIILALISILRRTSSFHQENVNKQPYTSNSPPTASSASGKSKAKKSRSNTPSLCEEMPPDDETSTASISYKQPHWLSRTLNLAFGSCVNIFQLQKIGRKCIDYFVTVHQQACLDVCKQTLEALSFLAKNFPSSFSPAAETDSKNSMENPDDLPGPSSSKDYGNDDLDSQNEFWDILVRLNSSTSGLKGKTSSKTLKDFPKLSESSSFVTSPLGQILSMLSHPVVKQNTMLTDKLLRLLSVISMSLPERPKHLQAQRVNREHTNTENAEQLSDTAVLPPELPHPIHTVTFADTDDILVSPERMLPPRTAVDEDEPGSTAGEAATVCSETASVTSSLFVELPEIADDRSLTEVRSPRPGSIISAFSEGTVVQSDISGAMGEQSIHPELDAETMAMDVDTVSHPISDTSSGDNRSSPALSMVNMPPEKEPSILIGQLRMAVNVLTTGTCSDEGLEDATTLLLQLSRTELMTRDSILELLLEGAQETAYCLRNQIKDLLFELKERNAKSGKSSDKSKGQKPSVAVIMNPSPSRSQPWRGRGGRSTSQVRRRGLMGQQIPRRNMPKPIVYDLHLPAMATLTAKRSSQSLFLRILKVILQLRDAAKKIAKKPSQTGRLLAPSRPRGFRLLERLHHSGNSLREVVAALEADMEAMYEMIDRFGGNVTQSTGRNANQANERSNTSDNQDGNAGDNPDEAGPSIQATTDEVEDKKEEKPEIPKFPCLSSQLQLDDLWDVLGEVLTELAETTDTNAVLVLQPAVEAFFLVHGSEKDDEEKKDEKESTSASSIDVPLSPGPYSPGPPLSPAGSRHGSQTSSYTNLPQDTQKFLRFAETHRTVLNQILRQTNSQLSDGPFAVLVNHTRLLDFDIKRRYFRQELESEDKGHRREDMAVHIRRDHVFEDSYRELHRRNAEDIKNRLYIVFDGEEGQDAGGLLREWYSIMAREMFNPNYALFTTSQGEKATYLPNRNSHFHENHLSYFKFAGRIVAKAIYDNKLLDCYFTRSFYKHILSKTVTYTDMESEDYSFYQGLVYLLENHINDLGYELTFSLEVQRFGLNEVHDLKPNGRNILVTEQTKREYVKLVCIEKMTGSIRQQIDNFLEGFYEIIPKRLISIFDEQELELLIAGLPTIDIEDLKLNTEYHKYTDGSLQIQWFWRALRSFEQADRAKFLQFVTGTSKVPLQGFSMLEGMNGPQKFQIHRDDRSTDRLPCAHTCFNQLDLPPYETYDKLFSQLLKAVQECTEGFGLA